MDIFVCPLTETPKADGQYNNSNRIYSIDGSLNDLWANQHLWIYSHIHLYIYLLRCVCMCVVWSPIQYDLIDCGIICSNICVTVLCTHLMECHIYSNAHSHIHRNICKDYKAVRDKCTINWTKSYILYFIDCHKFRTEWRMKRVLTTGWIGEGNVFAIP